MQGDPNDYLALAREAHITVAGSQGTFDHATSGSWLDINTWGVTDPWGMQDATNVERFNTLKTGLYFCAAAVIFPASATGQRGVRLLLSGSTVVTTQFHDAAASGQTHISVAGFARPAIGAYWTIQAYQDSGGTLSNLQSNFVIHYMGTR